jgi:hypothetical protein
MRTRTISLPTPTIGRTVLYAGYTPGTTQPATMVATIIAAPGEPRWNDPVTLEIVAPNGERTVLERIRCSPAPELPTMGCFTWPRLAPNQDVLLDETGYVLEAVGRAAYPPRGAYDDDSSKNPRTTDLLGARHGAEGSAGGNVAGSVGGKEPLAPTEVHKPRGGYATPGEGETRDLSG